LEFLYYPPRPGPRFWGELQLEVEKLVAHIAQSFL
jgi:hypothetical protein